MKYDHLKILKAMNSRNPIFIKLFKASLLLDIL